MKWTNSWWNMMELKRWNQRKRAGNNFLENSAFFSQRTPLEHRNCSLKSWHSSQHPWDVAVWNRRTLDHFARYDFQKCPYLSFKYEAMSTRKGHAQEWTIATHQKYVNLHVHLCLTLCPPCHIAHGTESAKAPCFSTVNQSLHICANRCHGNLLMPSCDTLGWPLSCSIWCQSNLMDPGGK